MVVDLMKNLKINHSATKNSPPPALTRTSSAFVPNDYHNQIVNDLLESYHVHDICLIGARGSGKSIIVKELADRLSLDIEPIMMYQDMTARDLLQQRSTLPNGDTIWRPSTLVSAALEGKIAVMDGLHRLNSGTLFTIQRLSNFLNFFGSSFYRYFIS